MPSARYGGTGRTDGFTWNENLPLAGTCIHDSRCVGMACGAENVTGVVLLRIVFVYRLKSLVTFSV
jgi:hypothetical protein